jgi:thiamine-phosphate pyrophosphorylase
MRGLYPIIDLGALEARSLDPIAIARALVGARPACIQLRAKGIGSRRSLELLRELRRVTREGGVRLFANDRPDLAILAGCDGVHLGQDDVPPGLAKHLAELSGHALLVGRSTHDEPQLLAALEEPIDYVAVGPVHATASKVALSTPYGSSPGPDPVLGADRARALATLAKSRRPELPVCAIGGIDAGRAAELARDFDLVAVIGALYAGASGAGDGGDAALRISSALGARDGEARP